MNEDKFFTVAVIICIVILAINIINGVYQYHNTDKNIDDQYNNSVVVEKIQNNTPIKEKNIKKDNTLDIPPTAGYLSMGIATGII